jgi:hypothetical protein
MIAVGLPACISAAWIRFTPITARRARRHACGQGCVPGQLFSGRLHLAESHAQGWPANSDLTPHGHSRSWHVCGRSGTCELQGTYKQSRAAWVTSYQAAARVRSARQLNERPALKRPACCCARTAHGLLLQLGALVQHADVHQHAAGLLPARPRPPSHRSVHRAMRDFSLACAARRGGWRAGARRGLGCIFTPSQPWHSLSRLNACAPPVPSTRSRASSAQRSACPATPSRRRRSGGGVLRECSARPPGHRPARAPAALNTQRSPDQSPAGTCPSWCSDAVARLAPRLGSERVREREEGGAVAALRAQREVALQVLVVQHRLHALARDIPARRRPYVDPTLVQHRLHALARNVPARRGGARPAGGARAAAAAWGRAAWSALGTRCACSDRQTQVPLR